MNAVLDIHPYGTLTLTGFERASHEENHENFIRDNWEALAGYAYLQYRERGGGALALVVEDKEMHYLTEEDGEIFEQMADDQARDFIRLYDPELHFVILIVCPGKKQKILAYRYGAKNMTPKEASEKMMGSLLQGLDT
ncbi:MAG TPA: hypothetical protein PK014_04500 [Thermoanaerobaculia bacterium]|nr:hypothetical protein [Thermoanaerobaculia bacterium]HUM29317.1 hypothetical protein [Thermoanaerobaculia bacterium]HXK67725.1 hypothetical protein [Thermoanaerobaculia bacterium]